MFKKFINKISLKKDNIKRDKFYFKKKSFINSFKDLDDIMKNNNRYSDIKSIKIFNKGGFDHILKFKNYKDIFNKKNKKILFKKFSTIKYIELKNNKRKKYIIYPDSKIYLIINLIVGIAILYSVTFIPFDMAFLIEKNYKWTLIIESIWDLIFIFDLIQNFFNAYYDKNFNLIDNLKNIAFNYIFSWFIWDFLSSFPLSLIDVIKNTNNNNSISQNFTKLTRISKLPKILKLFRFTKLIKKFSYFKNKINESDSLLINPAFKRLFKTLFLVIIFLHLFTCLWFICATWFFPLNNWVVQLDYINKSNTSKYIASLYWVVQTIFTVGYGDFPAYNYFEKILALILMILGVFVYSLVVGSVSSLFFSMNIHLKNKYKNLEIWEKFKKSYKISNSDYKETKYIIEKNL